MKNICTAPMLSNSQKNCCLKRLLRRVFSLNPGFFEMMEKRLKKYSTLLLAYKIKVLQESGSMPQIKQCVLCGNKDEAALFSIRKAVYYVKNVALNIQIWRMIH